jgi:sn-glycerol 3-phosphate transport system substrate-binding protein
MPNLRASLLSAVSVVAFSFSAQAQEQPIEIQFWFGLGGALGERVVEQVERFNASQDNYRVVATFRGSYAEVMTGAIGAWRAGNPPHIGQVFEVGTATMMAAREAILPVHQLLADAGVEIDPARYLPGVRGYFSDTEGRLISMPHNTSSAIMWINLDAFERAGLSTTDLPATWAEVRAAAEAIRDTGAAPCALTTAWPTWTLFEQTASIHNVPFATGGNGFQGLDTQMELTGDFFQTHVQNIVDMQSEGLFRYGGRDSAADSLFPSGECAISFNSSAARARVAAEAKFNWASVPLPYYDDVVESPYNGVIGGASLWVFQTPSRTAEEYRGIAEFFDFISDTEQDVWWHQVTGYVPLTLAAYEQSRAEGFYEANPGADAAITQLSRAEPTEYSQGFRLGGMIEIRNIIQEELERTLQGRQTVERALANANNRGNQVLRNFERTNARAN